MLMHRSIYALALLSLSLLSGMANAADLTVQLHGIRVQAGNIMMTVVDSQDSWDGKAKPVAREALVPDGDTATVTFEGLEPGDYAVMIAHDENSNGKLDTNLIGMPTEGYGFSNNPRVMRKPTWDEARIALGADAATLRIELR